MKKSLSFILLALCACSGNDVQQTLGLGVNSPDEFMVMTHPPLEVPSNFTLQAPGSTPNNLAATPITDEAAQILFRKNTTSSQPTSKGETALLSKASADEVDPDIRRKLYTERQEAVQDRLAREESAFGNLNPWNHSEKDPIVDAAAEKKRIEEALKEGQTITSDGVKEKSRKPKAPLEGIFN